MKIIEKFFIHKNADIIYTKRVLQSHFDEEKFLDKNFFILAFMELATNLLKYADEGEVFLFEVQEYYALGVTDNGKGIQNIDKALQRGYSTATNSLGLGLYLLHQNDMYDFEIFSTTKKEFHGTVLLLKPKRKESDTVFLSDPYINEANNGDFFARKGKFLLFGDAAGHNKKAHKTADFIQKQFFSTTLSCIMVDDFFASLNRELQHNQMRGAVCVVGQIVKNHISLCGVGDLVLWMKEEGSLLTKTFKNGIIGEVFSSTKKIDLRLGSGEFCVIGTDGIDRRKMEYFKHLSMEHCSAYFIAFVMLHFAGSNFDDSSLVVIKNKRVGDKNA